MKNLLSSKPHERICAVTRTALCS